MASAASPRASLVIVNCNQGQYLASAIQSILRQTDPNFELIVWDDGSTDDSVTIAKALAQKDARIRVVQAAHQGVNQARIQAMGEAIGNYVGYVDGDDVLAPTALAETVKILEQNPQIGWVYTDYQEMSANGQVLGLGHRTQIPYSPQGLLLNFMTFHFRLIRRSVYQQIHPDLQREGTVPYVDDYDLCLHLSELAPAYHLKKPLYYYRLHGHSISHVHWRGQIQSSAEAVEKALIRRGLADRYQLSVDYETGNVALLPKLNYARQLLTQWGAIAAAIPLAIALSLGSFFTVKTPAEAQSITAAPDGIQTQVTADQGQYNITGGTEAGHNLFHSFYNFGLNTGETANFISPNANIANILGRVTGGNPSLINGLIQVTGAGSPNLFLMNPAGMVFGPNASLNLPGSFTATSATGIGFDSGGSFNAWGSNNYTLLVGSPNQFNFSTLLPTVANTDVGGIFNWGTLSVHSGQTLSLFGRSIFNAGTLSAAGGTVNAIAVPEGHGLVLSQPGMVLSLEIAPDSGLVGPSPTETLKAIDLPLLLTEGQAKQAPVLEQQSDGSYRITSGTLVNSGSIAASDGGQIQLQAPQISISGDVSVAGTPLNPGGRVLLLGDRVGLVGAIVDASGGTEGGEILVGGDAHGQGTLPKSIFTNIDAGTILKADALNLGNGGKIVAWSEGITTFQGKASAQGGATGGNGGFIEISGKEHLNLGHWFDRIHLGASQGQAGTLLFDPINITIVSGSGSSISGTGDTTVNTQSSIYADDVSAFLNSPTGGNLTITTTNPAYSNYGDLTMSNASISWTTNNSLTLNADRSITLNNATISNTGSGSISLQANTAGVSPGTFTGIDLQGTSQLSTNAGNLSLKAIAGTGAGYSAQPQVGVKLGASARVSSVNGDITIDGTGGAVSSSYPYTGYNRGVSAGGIIQATGTGNITITGKGGTGYGHNDGVSTYGSIQTTSGSISITGIGNAGTTGNSNQGITSSGGSISTTTGSITLAGTAGAGSAYNRGIKAGSSITTQSGAITVTGKANVNTTTGIYNEGVYLSGSSILSTGTTGSEGKISITGYAGLGKGYNSYSSTHNTGVVVKPGANGGPAIVSNGAAVEIKGYGTTDPNATTDSNGVNIQGAVQATNAATVGVTGFGGRGTNFNHGVSISSTGNISSENGNITMDGTASSATTGTNNRGISTQGTIVSTGTGAVSLTGTGGGGTDSNEGVITSGGSISSSSNITIDGTGGTSATGQYNRGMSLGGTTITSTGNAQIKLTGTGGGGTNYNYGVASYGGSIASVDGNITIDGTGSTSAIGQNNGGIALGGTITSTGNAQIKLTGTGGSGSNSTGISVYSNLTTSSGSITLTGNAINGNEGVQVLTYSNLKTQTGNLIITGNTDQPTKGISMTGANLTAQNVQLNGKTISISDDSVPVVPSTIAGNGGTLSFQALSTSTDLNLNFNSPNALKTGGFSQINLGRSGDTGAVNLVASSAGFAFSDPLTIWSQSKEFTLNSNLLGSDNGSVTINGSGNTTILNAGILTTSNPITINDRVVLGTNITTLDTTYGGKSPNGANITITGAIDGQNGGETLTAFTGNGRVSAGIIGGTKAIGALTVQGNVPSFLQNITLTNGSLTLNTPVSLSGDATFDVGTGTINLPQTLNTNGSNLTLRGNEINFTNPNPNGINGGGNLVIEPGQANWNIDLARSGSIDNALNFTTTDIDALAPGFNSITIGRSDGNAILSVLGSATFKDPVTLQMPVGTGTIDTSGGTLTAQKGAALLANSDITTGGITVNANALKITSNAGTVTVNQGLTHTGIGSGNDITIAGNSATSSGIVTNAAITTNGGGITLTGISTTILSEGVRLNSNITSNQGAVSITGTSQGTGVWLVNGGTIDTGGGSLDITGTNTGSTRWGVLIDALSGGLITNGGNVTLKGQTFVVGATSVGVSQNIAAGTGNITLQGDRLITIGQSSPITFTSGNLQIQDNTSIAIKNTTFNSSGTQVTFNSDRDGNGGGTLSLTNAITNISSNANITLTGEDQISLLGGTTFNSSGGAGTLTVAPSLSSSNLTLTLDTVSQPFASDGFTGITIGRSDSTGTLTLTGTPTLNFASPLTFWTPTADFTLSTNLQGIGRGSFTLNGSGHSTTLNANIITAGQPIALNDSIILGTNAVLDSTNAGSVPTGANIGITGTVEASSPGGQNLTVSAGNGAFTLGGTLGATNPLNSFTLKAGSTNLSSGLSVLNGTLDLNVPITLASASTFSAGTGSVILRNTLNAGANPVTFTADSISLLGGTDSIQGTGTILLQPTTPSQPINLIASTIDAIAPGFSNLTIGRSDGSGLITLSQSLNFKNPVTLQTPTGNGQISGSGITVNGTDRLTLIAGNSIDFNDLTLQPGNSNPLTILFAADADNSGAGHISIGTSQTGSNIRSGGGSITLAGGNNTGTGFAQGSISGRGPLLGTGVNLQGAQVDAQGGNATVRGIGLNNLTGNAAGIFLGSSTIKTSGSGAVELIGTGGGYGFAPLNVGINVQGSTIAAESGTVQLTGTGGISASQGHGILVDTNSYITSTTGKITITGTGDSTSSDNNGILLKGGSYIGSSDGAITVTGTGSSVGVGLQNGSIVQTRGSSGTISLNGSNTIAGDGIRLEQGSRLRSEVSVTLRSAESIALDSAVINSASNPVAVSLNATGGGGIALINGANITSNGGTIALGSANNPAIGAAFRPGGVLVANSTLSSGGGATTLYGTGSNLGTGRANGVEVTGSTTGSILNSGSGVLTVVGVGGTSSSDWADGVNIHDNATVTAQILNLTGTGGTSPINTHGIDLGNASITTIGEMTLQGTAGAANANVAYKGIYLRSGTTLASNSGAIALTGTGGSGTGSFNEGILVGDNGGSATITSNTGEITLTGTGRATGTNNSGIDITSNSSITTGSTKGITLTGTGSAGTNGFVFHSGTLQSSAGGPITFIANTIAFNGGILQGNGSGQLFLKPLDLASPFSLTVTGAQPFQNSPGTDFTQVTIGDASTTNTIALAGTMTFSDPLKVLSGQSINASTAALTGEDDATIAMTATQSIITGSIINPGRSIALNTTGTLGTINTSAGSLDTTGTDAGGIINLSADGDITIGSLFASAGTGSSSNGGSITVTSTQGSIQGIVGDGITSDSDGGAAGTIQFNAGQNIALTGGSITANAKTGSGGTIQLTAGSAINSSGLSLSTQSQSGAGGSVTLKAQGDVSLNNVQTATGGNLGGAIDVTSQSGSVSLINLDSHATTGQAGAITLKAPVNILLGNLSVGGTTPGTAVSLTSDEIDFRPVSSASATENAILSLQPSTAGIPIHLGGATDTGTGSLDLTASDLTALGNGFSSITIGSSSTLSPVTVDGSITFSDPITFYFSNMTVNGVVQGIDNASLTFNGGGNALTLKNNITTQGQPIAINNSLVLGANALIATTASSASGANIQVNGPIEGTTAGAELLTIDSGSGTVTPSAAIGGSVPLGGLTVKGTGGLTLSNNVTTANNTGILATTIALNTPTTITAPLTLTAQNGRLVSTNTLNVVSSNLTISADAIQFLGGDSTVTGKGNLILQPFTLNRNINLLAPALDGSGGVFTGQSLLALATGFNSLTIGNADGSGTITLDSGLTFRNPTTLRGQSPSAGGYQIVGSPVPTTFTVTANNSGSITDGGLIFQNNGQLRFINATTLTGGTSPGDRLVVNTGNNETIALATPNTGSVAGLNFQGIETVDAQGTSDLLQGTSGTDQLLISGQNSGNVAGGINFAGIENIDSGAGDDTLTLLSTGSISGTLSGGDGTDRLDFSQQVGNLTVNLAQVGATGIEVLVGNAKGQPGDPVSTLRGPDQGGTVNWTLSGPINGTVQQGSALNFSFSGFNLIAGGAADDVFTLTPGVPLPITLDGGLGTDRLDYSNFTTPISVNLANQTATGILGFQNLEGVIGGSSPLDRLQGRDSGSTFSVTGSDQGTTDGNFSFSSIENLQGGLGNDRFAFAGGSLTGTIDGGLGDNTLDYSGANQSVAIDLNTHTASSTTSFANIQQAIGSTVGGNTLTALTPGNTFTLTGLDSGSLGTGFRFVNFQNLVGGLGDDRLNFLPGSRLSGNFSDPGGNLTLVGDTLGFGSLTGTGTLQIQPQSNDRPIALGDTSTPNALILSSQELASIQGFANVVIGTPLNNRLITGVGNIRVRSPLTLQAPASGGAIDLTGATFTTSGTPLTLLADQSIRTGSITTNGGSLTFTSNQGGITSLGTLQTSNPSDRGGDITLTAPGAIVTADLNTSGGKGGNIQVRSQTSITTGGITTQGFNGKGGDVLLDPPGDVQVSYIDTRGTTQGGNVHIETGQFFRATGVVPGTTDSIITTGNLTGIATGGAITIYHNGVSQGEYFIVGTAIDPVSADGTFGGMTSGNLRLPTGRYGRSVAVTLAGQFDTPTGIDQSPNINLIVEGSLLQVPDPGGCPPDCKEGLPSIDIPFIVPIDATNLETPVEKIEANFSDAVAGFNGVNRPKTQTLPQIQNNLQTVEKATGIKPAIIYVIFSPTTVNEPEPLGSQSSERKPGDKVTTKPGSDRHRSAPQILWEFSDGSSPFPLAQAQLPSSQEQVARPTDELELVLVTAHGNPTRVRVAGANRSRVEQAATILRQEISDPTKTNNSRYLQPSRLLYNWIIRPLQPTLEAQGIQNLVFVMESGLRTLPIAALNDGKSFLVEKYSAGLMPSLSLTDTRYRDIRQVRMLAMGASKFNDQNDLPTVPVELETIAGKIWKGQYFLNQDFTIDNLRRYSQNFGIIHLATHADFLPGSVNNSYIALPTQRLEINRLKDFGWRGADSQGDTPVELLTLSACKTAVGSEDAELGFAGLAVQAGVKTAFASLWYVSDAATTGLMTKFYEMLSDPKVAPIKAEALRQAQLAFIHGQVSVQGSELRGVGTTRGSGIQLPPNSLESINDKELTHPYYWASFTLVGSPW